MLFFRRYVPVLKLPAGDTIPTKVMADISVLTVRNNYKVVRQMYRPLLSSFTVVHPTSRSGKMKLQTYHMKLASRFPRTYRHVLRVRVETLMHVAASWSIMVHRHECPSEHHQTQTSSIGLMCIGRIHV